MLAKDALAIVDEIRRQKVTLDKSEDGFISTVVIQCGQGRNLQQSQGDKLQALYRQAMSGRGRQSRELIGKVK